MTSEQIESMRADFREWSGGFKPSDQHEVTVYLDYTAPPENGSTDEQREALYAWMDEETD